MPSPSTTTTSPEAACPNTLPLVLWANVAGLAAISVVASAPASRLALRRPVCKQSLAVADALIASTCFTANPSQFLIDMIVLLGNVLIELPFEAPPHEALGVLRR